MTNKNFYNQINCSIESMKENSLFPLPENDKDYQRYSNYGGVAEAEYIDLVLLKEHRKVIDNLLDSRDNKVQNIPIFLI